jgi:hypothetical protein
MSRFSNWLSQHGAKCATIALLAVPTVLPQFTGSREVNENRKLAPLPILPTTWSEFLALPAQTDAWVKDHFGYRTELVEANNVMRYTVFGEFPSVRVTSGLNNRIFVTAHATAAQPYSAVVEICDVNDKMLKEFGNYLNILFGSFETMGLSPKLMIVPSAPAVHSADLPKWLSKRCSGDVTPVSTLLKSDYIKPSVKSEIHYPLAQMRSRNQDVDLFPRHWFHWNGPGVEEVAQGSMSRLFPAVQTAAPRLVTRTVERESDIHPMFPGIKFNANITEPDYAASKIQSCYGTTCFPEFKGFEEPLYDVSRFHNPAAPDRRLMILSDSFGRYIAGWYTRYYRTVEHVAVNNVRDLQRDQVKVLKEFTLRDPGKTDILFIFHDGALSGTMRLGLQRFHRNGEGGMQEMHDPADYAVLAQQIYVAYLGRPGDLEGMQSLQRQLSAIGAPLELHQLNLAYVDNSDVRSLIDSFGKSQESVALYSGDANAFISSIYLQMFNRRPDAGGLRYWAEQIENGKLTRGRALLAIAAASLLEQSQQGLLDGNLLRKKVTYSSIFTASLSSAKRQCYGGAAAAQHARNLVAAVNVDTDVQQSKVAAAKMSDDACK